MAAPHVAGAAARCFAAGECGLARRYANTQLFLAAMADKFKRDRGYRWSRDSSWAGNFYGPLVWAARW